MKVTLILILFCNLLLGQTNGYVEYRYNVIHSINYETKSVLLFDSKQSMFTTFKNDKYNDSIPKLISDEGSNKAFFINKDNSKKPIFFIDKNVNKLINKVWKFKKNYILSETIPNIPWKVKSEYKTVSGLYCQKAVGYFRGRVYTVWFTEEIPVSLGPWKLQGLPGLILEAQDDKGIFYYQATKIKLNIDVPQINMPNINDSISLKTFISKIQPEKIKEINNRLQAKVDRSITLDTSIGLNRSSFKELIYEWEEKED